MPFTLAAPTTFGTTPVARDWERALSWNPNVLYPEGGQGRSQSTETRPPNRWDIHLGSEFICKRVVHAPDLQKKFALLVDKKMEEIKVRGEEIGSLTESDLKDKALGIEANICLESGVERQYLLGTSSHCLPLASRLLLNPRGKDVGCHLVWVEPTFRSSATCDGVLRLGDSATGTKRAADGCPPDVDASTWSKLQEAKEIYPDMATWEMKNLTVGDLGTMLAILGIANGFQAFEWPSCKDPKRGQEGHMHDDKPCGDSPGPQPLYDDPEILTKFGLDQLEPTP